MDFQKDYYDILGLMEDASPAEIKQAYRKLAKKYHPDLNQGNVEYEEITKGLTEAYGVLGNQNNKFIYDQYRNSRRTNPNVRNDQRHDRPKSKNKRSFLKKSIVITKKRIYVTGELFIKYYALQDEILTENINDVYFKIHPKTSSAKIFERNVYRNEEPPADVKAIFLNHKASPFILTHTVAEIIYENHSDLYELALRNPVLINPKISDVTKHEGVSYGTLSGDFYAFFEFEEEHEIEEIVEECFGETGRKEDNSDENNIYHRVEYYNSDCTTYWGPWIVTPKRQAHRSPTYSNSSYKTAGRSRKKQYNKGYGSRANSLNYDSTGCGYIPGLFFLGLMLWVLLPMFGVLSWLFVILLSLLFLRHTSWFVNAFLGIGTILLAMLILSTMWNVFTVPVANIRPTRVKDKKEISQVKKTGAKNPKKGTKPDPKDEIISHYRVWDDYSGNRYEGDLKIFLSDYESSIDDHQAINTTIQSEADWSGIYKQMLRNDQDRLNMVYSLFDSIGIAKKLNRSQFAEMVVSCIQDIPYYVVLPHDCSFEGQGDPFVKNFLDENPGSCLGNIPFGVQSPGEFVGNLKGDCDTRVAVLFGILNHYKYKVAILASNQFRHSVLGIELPGEGLAKTYNGINYTMWETTSAGFKPGVLAPEVSDLNYWDFYLTN